MLVYLLLLLFVGVGVALSRPDPNPRKQLGSLLIACVVISLIVGLRYQVGADWQTYGWIFEEISYRDLDQVLTRGEPGFQLVNWAVSHAGIEVWLVNFICAVLFAIGLVAFARSQPDPWLVLMVSLAYLVTVVAMGYTRQAVAIGIVLAGLADFARRPSGVRLLVFVALAALFHRSAVCVYPIVAFAAPRNKIINALIAAAAAFALWDFFLSDAIDIYVRNYVAAAYNSQGALIRVALSAVAASVFFLCGRKLGFSSVEWLVWRNFSLVTMGLLLALAVSRSSTAVDRVALYMIPLQLAVMARTPMLFRDWRLGRAGVVGFEASIMLVWLNFAVHAQYWLPYRFYPL